MVCEPPSSVTSAFPFFAGSQPNRVAHLEVGGGRQDLDDSGVSLIPLRALSPVRKSLHVGSIRLPHPQVFGLVRSLPHLENLTLIALGTANNVSVRGLPTTIPTPPPLTGILELVQLEGMEPTARLLLDLPNGLHFRDLTLSWIQEGGIQWINAVIVECSDSVESLHLTYHPDGAVAWLLRRNQHLTPVFLFAGNSTRFSIDLSKAMRLEDIQLWFGPLSPQWITVALHTVTSEHRDLTSRHSRLHSRCQH